MFHCLNEILDLCHSFCSLVSQNLGPLDERGAAQLRILVKVSGLASGSGQPRPKDGDGFANGEPCLSLRGNKAFPHTHTEINNKIQIYKFKALLVDFEADNFVLPQHSKTGQPWRVYSVHQYASALLSLS